MVHAWVRPDQDNPNDYGEVGGIFEGKYGATVYYGFGMERTFLRVYLMGNYQDFNHDWQSATAITKWRYIAVNYRYKYRTGGTDIEVFIDKDTKRTTWINARQNQNSCTSTIGNNFAGTIRQV